MITVGELAPIWLSRKQSDVAPSNYRTLQSAWRSHVEPAWGTTRIANVDLNAVEQWLATMRRKSGATTVIRAYCVLAGILDDAVKARRLASNPARGVENLPHKTAKRRVYLTAEEVGRLVYEAAQHRTLVLVLAYTGIRWGEAVALRVKDVDSCVGACRWPTTRCSSAWITPLVTRSPARSARCRSRRSCSMSCRCSARAGVMMTSCSATAPITCPGRSRPADGSLVR